MKSVSIAELFHSKANRLGLTLVAGANGLSRTLSSIPALESTIRVVGYLDAGNPLSVQIINPDLHGRLLKCGKGTLQEFRQLFERGEIAVAVVSDNLCVPEWLLETGNQTGVCIYQSPLAHSFLYERLQHRTSRKLIRKTSLHGVFMSIRNVGVMITGPSGIGKSEVALDLISSGHRLVADDVIQVFRSSPYKLTGFCPELLRGYLEVRGLGILDIADIFGNTAVLDSLPVDLIVRLERDCPTTALNLDRLTPGIKQCTILETSLPEITLLVAPGRNLAVLIEAAVRTHIQYQFGKDPVRAFVEKQQRLIENRKRLLEKYSNN